MAVLVPQGEKVTKQRTANTTSGVKVEGPAINKSSLLTCLISSNPSLPLLASLFQVSSVFCYRHKTFEPKKKVREIKKSGKLNSPSVLKNHTPTRSLL